MSSRSRRLPALLGLCAMGAACGAPAVPAPVVVATPAIVAPPPDPCAQAAARLFATLDTPLSLTAYVTRGTPTLDAFVNDLRALLDAQVKLSGGKLRVKVIEDAAGDDRQRALDDEMKEDTFAEADPAHPNRALIVKGFLGIAFRLGSQKGVITVLSPNDRRGTAFSILNKVREVEDEAAGTRHPIGLLTGHDEIALSEPNLMAQSPSTNPSMRSIMEKALPFYVFRDVDLQGGDAAIDPALPGLIITQPAKELTSRELRRIDQFVMLGGKTLVVYAGAVNVKAGDAAITGHPGTHGLEKLLAGYGVEMQPGVLLDWGSPMRLTLGGDEKKIVLPYPPVLHAENDAGKPQQGQPFDASFAPFFRLDELVFPFASPLVPHPERQPTATVRAVARSSPRTSVLACDPMVLGVTSEWRPVGALDSYVIGVAVEGKLRSAFGGGSAQGVTLPAETVGGPSRVFVLASSQFLANPMARAGNPPPQPPQMAGMASPPGDDDLMLLANPYATNFLTRTILSFKNTLDWMINDPALTACSRSDFGEK